MTPREALEFFATRIELRAKSERVLLTESEKRVLRFSEVEPDGIKDLSLPAQFENDNEFEERMGDLLLRAYMNKRETLRSLSSTGSRSKMRSEITTITSG